MKHDEVTKMKTRILSPGSLSGPIAFLIFSSSILMSSARAEGYKPDQQDTRPVRQQPRPADPHAGLPGMDDTDTDVTESPFPDPKMTFDFHDLEMLCIQDGGRKKPLNTLINENIEQLVGRPVFATSPYIVDKKSGRRVGASELFLSIFLQPEEWKSAPIVLVAYRPLKEKLGLSLEEKHFSPRRLIGNAKLRKLWDSAIEKRRSGAEKEVTEMEQEAEIIQQRLNILSSIMQGTGSISIVPHPSDPHGTWLSLEALQASYGNGEKTYYPAEKAEVVFGKFSALVHAFEKPDSAKFALAAGEFRTSLRDLSPTVYPSFETLDREVTFNSLRPFGRAWIFYLGAVAFGIVAIRKKQKPAYIGMMAMFLIGMGFHVYGFVLRCLIAGRPPVSNMYESVIWVGFGAVFFGLIFELIYKRRYFAACGAAAGFMCLSLMDLLPLYTGNSATPGTSSSISPLQPVLRDNFWLTVHVLTITLSYAAFMLTWMLGHVTLGKHLFNPSAKGEQHELHQFVYRAMQVGVLLLAIGTILGGVWAYYSWGRFWGWDPKETWAFIALMCYLFVLHGRFTGWWGNFGMSVGSVVCFQAVVMAWYGVNFVLGSGLHAYGSGAGGKEIILPLVGLDMLFTIAAIVQHAQHKSKPPVDMPPTATAEAESTLTSADPITEVRALQDASPSAGE